MKYFLGLSSQYSNTDVFRHVFSVGSEYDLSELRAFLAAHYGATYDHVAVYANGRTALNVAVKAVAKRGGKVVITSLTCYAVIQAIKAAGCVPIFADVDPKTLHFGKKELEKAIEGESNVQAVIVQNNLGIPADIVGIEEVANAHKLAIIEDLAHCAGVKYADGREAGTVGRAIALSFGKGKSIDTVTGGAVVLTGALDTPVAQPTKAPKFKDNARARMYPLLSLIIRGFYYIHPKAGKYLTSALVRLGGIKRSADGNVDLKTRLTYWQCRLALSQLQALPHRGRKPIRDFYLVNDRETVLRKFELDGYYFNDIWYDLPVAPERYYHKADYHPNECPIATKLAQQIVNLPTHYDQAELKSALKIIQRYTADDTEFAELENEDNLTEAEKKAKIKAEKKSRKNARKAARTQSKNQLKQDSKELDKDAKDKSANNNTQKEQSVKKVAEKVAKIAKSKTKSAKAKIDKTKTKAEASVKETAETEAADLAALEQKSDILSAGAKPESKATQAKIVNKTKDIETEDVKTKVSKTQTAKTETVKNETAKTETAKTEATKTEVKSSSTPKKEPVMRVAPKKLTEREKLKLELENGRKDGPSVL